MKPLANKMTELTIGDGKADYAALCKHCINQPPQGGLTCSVIRERMRIMEALEGVDEGTIKLEDADAKVMLACINATTWGMLHKDLVQFFDDTDEALKG